MEHGIRVLFCLHGLMLYSKQEEERIQLWKDGRYEREMRMEREAGRNEEWKVDESRPACYITALTSTCSRLFQGSESLDGENVPKQGHSG